MRGNRMMGRVRTDRLLELSLLTDEEVQSLQTDVQGLQAGTMTGGVGSDFWQRAMVEMSRRQTNAQINLARRMVQATWALVFSTLLLSVVTVLVTLARN